MDIPLVLQLRVDDFYNIVDFFGYAKGDSEILKLAVLLVASQIIEDAQKYTAYPLEENRIPMKGIPGSIGVSFSLIFKDRESIYKFLDTVKF